jgi:ribosomal protein S20
MVGKATRFDDYSTTNTADVYGTGWLKVLQSIGKEKSCKQLQSTKLPIAELDSPADMKVVIPSDNYYSEQKVKVEVENSEEYVPKKSRRTFRSDVYTVLREIKEQINKGEKDVALQLLVSRAEQLDFSSFEINFAATKVRRREREKSVSESEMN